MDLFSPHSSTVGHPVCAEEASLMDLSVSLYSSMYICYSVLSVSTGSQFSVPTFALFFIVLARLGING
nr:hypothetical protein CFP56_08672 [Quercus suber]